MKFPRNPKPNRSTARFTCRASSKTGLAIPEDNSVDIYAHDLGLLAIVEEGQIVGYNFLVGGGMGMTHGNANTFPFIAKPICYVNADQLIPALEGVIKLFRDHAIVPTGKGPASSTSVHDWGVEKFREVLATYLPFPLVLPRAVEVKDLSPCSWAGTLRGTANSFTASAWPAAGSRTKAIFVCVPACAPWYKSIARKSA